jgi:rubrerythrin
MSNRILTYLGNLSSAPPERSVLLACHACGVRWVGCQDAAECPRCGSTSDYEGKVVYCDGDSVFVQETR